MAFLLKRRWLMVGLARALAVLGRLRPKPIKVGSLVLVTRHAHVVDALRRDTDFLAGDSYRDEIERTNGPFVLGMDRGPQLSRESLALYSALGRYDLKQLAVDAKKEAQKLLETLGSDFDAVQDFVWPVCGWTTQRMFGLGGVDPLLFRHVSRSIFYHVFLDVAKSSAVRERAIAAGELLKSWLSEEIARRRASGSSQFGSDFMGLLMADATLDDDAIRRTLGGVLVGSIDTINGVAARVLTIVDRSPKLRQRMIGALQRPVQFNGYCLEAHRHWAQTPMIVRRALRPTQLGGTSINAGDRLFLFTHAAMFDAGAFNNPLHFRPDRPATSYLHYGGGVHACAGRALADMQVPMLVQAFLERDFRISGRMKWAGPFPDRLRVELRGGSK